MAAIGSTFTTTSSGFASTLQTIRLKAKVTIALAEKRGESQPDYRSSSVRSKSAPAGRAPTRHRPRVRWSKVGRPELRRSN
jgi:uncharacterized protein (DUF736 family)